MPVQSNFAIQYQPRVVWDGTTSRPIDIRKHVGFAFAFEVTTTLAADAVFEIQAAMPSEADRCVPGAWESIPEIPTCQDEAVAAVSRVTIPSGTTAGSVCTGTIPCRNGAFIRVISVSGPTDDVLVAAVLALPKM